jgi:hypothetical protein
MAGHLPIGSEHGAIQVYCQLGVGRWNFTPVPLPSAETSPSPAGSATPISSGQTTPLPDEETELRLTVVTVKYESNMWKKTIESSGLIALQEGTEGTLTVEWIL